MVRPAVYSAAKASWRTSTNVKPIISSRNAIKATPGPISERVETLGCAAATQAATPTESRARNSSGAGTRLKGGAKARTGAMRRLSSRLGKTHRSRSENSILSTHGGD